MQRMLVHLLHKGKDISKGRAVHNVRGLSEGRVLDFEAGDDRQTGATERDSRLLFVIGCNDPSQDTWLAPLDRLT